MKQQTYIFILTDTNGRTVNFERFAYKRLKTCLNRMIQLYRKLKNYSFVKEDLEKTEKIIAYQTEYETTADNKVLEIEINDFIKMIGV